MTSQEIESSLERQIAPWLEHMRWRSDFDLWRQKRLWQENYQSEALADFDRAAAGVPPLAPVLDLGAGMGGFAVALARRSRPITALDYNPAYCEIIRTRARRYDLDLPALVAAGEALPFANGSFAVVTCWDVLEHVQNPGKLLSEIARVLRPGGRALITVINRLALVDPHYHLRGINWLPRPLAERYIDWRRRTKRTALQDRQRLSEMHYYTYAGFAGEARRSGFVVEDLLRKRSRFHRLPGPLGSLFYLTWRTFGMGTFRVRLTREDRA